MKNNYIYLVVVLILGIIGGMLFRSKTTNTTENQPTCRNCLADTCLAIQDLEYPAGELTEQAKTALDEAINDEYRALATYKAVIDQYGNIRPFSMIIGAEEQHIASLKSVYEKYGLAVPKDQFEGSIVAPSSVEFSCQAGVEAETNNASLYEDKLIPMVSDYEDITAVFTNLMNASNNKHLPAFQKCI